MAKQAQTKKSVPGAGSSAGKGISSGRSRAMGGPVRPRMPSGEKSGIYLTDPKAVDWYRLGTKVQDKVLALLSSATEAKAKKDEGEKAIQELKNRLDEAATAYTENENAATYEALEKATAAYDTAKAKHESTRKEHNIVTTTIMMLNGALARLGGEVRKKDDVTDEEGNILQAGEDHKERKERFKRALDKLAPHLPAVAPDAKLPNLGVLAIATGLPLEEVKARFTVVEKDEAGAEKKEVLFDTFPEEVRDIVKDCMTAVEQDKQDAIARREAMAAKP